MPVTPGMLRDEQERGGVSGTDQRPGPEGDRPRIRSLIRWLPSEPTGELDREADRDDRRADERPRPLTDALVGRR